MTEEKDHLCWEASSPSLRGAENLASIPSDRLAKLRSSNKIGQFVNKQTNKQGKQTIKLANDPHVQ